jgi:hypothetical protein
MGLSDAIDALHAGDLAGLARLLDAAPELVHARVAGAGPHYEGYFHEATLLHHVAGNPFIRPLPDAIVAIAALILDRGAEVDAVTHAGPSQPTDIGWSALGLVATSLEARTRGVQRPLLELLVARGADVDVRDGGALVGALYYGEADAARWLVEHGARVDLVCAAGLGRVDRMEATIDTPDAHTRVDYARRRPRPSTRADLLGLALAYAARGGHVDAARWLLDRGADPSWYDDATPLHLAALGGHAGVVELLLARGADPTVRDPDHHGTPRGWAEYGGHPEVAALLP